MHCAIRCVTSPNNCLLQSWREQLQLSLLAVDADCGGDSAQTAWLPHLPRSYSRYGDLALFPEGSLDHSSFAQLAASGRLWPAVCRLLRVRRLAIVRRVARDGIRSSRSHLLYAEAGSFDDPAEATVATCVEHGVSLSWDVSDCMFSRGNAAERHRLVAPVAEAVRSGRESCIVDLFAGIGYFTLPLLARTQIPLVIAVDWNPTALHWLRRNVAKNRIDQSRCRVVSGDNRLVAPVGLADRVLLGLVPSSRLSWSTACRCLGPRGGWLHVHENCDSPGDKSNKDANKDCPVLGDKDTSATFENREAAAAHLNAFLNSPHAPPAEAAVEESPPGANIGADNESPVECPADAEQEAEEPPPACSRSRTLPAWLDMAASIRRELRRHLPSGWRVRADRIQFVKWYAPRVAHLVFDIECRPPDYSPS